MKLQYYLYFVNVLSSMGYSLIAPLFPPMAKAKGYSSIFSGAVISTYSIFVVITITETPFIIQKLGRKKSFIYSIVIQAICTLSYSILDKLNGGPLYLMSFLSRMFHGIGCGVLNVILYSYTIITNTDKNELKIVMGYMEFCWNFGTTIGPIFVSFFYLIGGFSLPFIANSLVNLIGIIWFYYFDFPEENNEQEEDTSVIKLLLNKKILIYFVAVMVELNMMSFFSPTLTNYLVDNFHLSIEISSIFFIFTVVGYMVLLHYINFIIEKITMKLTVILGLFIAFIGSLFIATFPILPFHPITIAIGLFIAGSAGSLVNIPMFLEVNDIVRNNYHAQEGEAGDKASALFNLSINVGDSWSPLLGGFLTTTFCFQASSYFGGFICLVSAAFFYLVFKSEIDLIISTKFSKKETKNIKEVFIDDES